MADAGQPDSGGETSHSIETLARRWRTADPARLVGRGHPVGDFLEAYDWIVVEERTGFLKVSCHLPAQVRNPRGDLFGGFTPTYADFIAVFTGRAGNRQEPPATWLNTASLCVDYFQRIDGGFLMEGQVLHRSGRTMHMQIRFTDAAGKLLALARATIIEQQRSDETQQRSGGQP